jgi:hypothetical protein
MRPLLAILLAAPLLAATDPPPTHPASSTLEPPAAKEQRPRRVWVVLDFYKEFGGTVVREDEAALVVRTPGGEERSVDRSAVISATPLLDDPAGTPVVVRYRDDRRVKALLVEDGLDGATVDLRGMRTVIPRSEIWGLEREVPFEVLLARYRKVIPANAWPQRIALARWAMDQDHPEIAVEELQEVVKHQESDEVRKLLKLAEIADRSRKTGSTPAAGASPRPSPAATPPTEAEQPRLQESDVNLIRVMEVDLTRPPRMEAQADLAAELVGRFGPERRLPADGDTVEKLSAWTAPRLLTLLFQLKARDLYGRIRVAEDPEHLRVYRKQVHDAWLVPNCATSRCHGGEQAGALRLVRDQPRDARTSYTNLVHVLRFRTSAGESLLDFDNPSASALLDMGRPRESARRPHPAVSGWKPSVRGGRGEPETSVVAWLRGMHRPRPEYPVTLEPPDAPAVAPAGTAER